MYRKSAFTLIELLVVIAIIAVLAAMLFPVFAQARAAARSVSCVSNVKQVALGVLMYAQDYDETIPLMDNNGSSTWGCCPTGGTSCYPDFTDPGGDPNEQNTLFTGVLQPYIKNRQIGYCPEAGVTNWTAAIGNPAITSRPYVKALDDKGIYQSTFSQVAVNGLLTEFGPDANWSACQAGGTYTTSDGRLASWARPAELMLLTADSVWGEGINGDPSPELAVGNALVWPAYTSASANCFNYGGFPINTTPGFTWYLHRASERTGHFADPSNTRFDLGINSGFANIAFGDGHVKAFRRNNLERCDYNTNANVWTYTYWDPRY